MSDFSAIIAQWQTFYLMVGTASATLIGLLFVAVSIHIDDFHRKASADLHHFAALTFNCFFYTLLISILFLVPKLSALGLGITLLLLGGLGLMNMIVQKYRIQTTQSKQQNKRLATRFNIPILSLSGWLVVAIGVLLQVGLSLYGLIVVIILLLISASQNAWSLLVQTGDPDLKHGESRRR